MFRKLLRSEQNDENVIGKIVIKPGERAEFIVGVYEDVIPQPNLEFQLNPNRARVSAMLGRMDGRGDYTLMYDFVNFDNKTCEITVYASWDDAAFDSVLV